MGLVTLFVGIVLGVALVGIPALVSYSTGTNVDKLDKNQFRIVVEPNDELQNEIAEVVTKEVSNSYLRRNYNEIVVENVEVEPDEWVAVFRLE